MAGDVAAAVTDATDRLDAEIVVADRAILRQLRGPAIDIEAVVPRPGRDVALQEAVVILLVDQEAIIAACPDDVSADEVVIAAEGRVFKAEANARAASVKDDVAGDQGATSSLDGDALPAVAVDPAGVGDTVLCDHVSGGGGILTSDGLRHKKRTGSATCDDNPFARLATLRPSSSAAWEAGSMPLPFTPADEIDPRAYPAIPSYQAKLCAEPRRVWRLCGSQAPEWHGQAI